MTFYERVTNDSVWKFMSFTNIRAIGQNTVDLETGSISLDLKNFDQKITINQIALSYDWFFLHIPLLMF